MQTDSGNLLTVNFTGPKKIRLFLLIIALLLGNGHLSVVTAITELEVLNYKACFDGVPLRERPDRFAPRTTTIPKGTLVKVDVQRGNWLRVIYRVPQGYFIGWSLATMLCPLNQ